MASWFVYKFLTLNNAASFLTLWQKCLEERYLMFTFRTSRIILQYVKTFYMYNLGFIQWSNFDINWEYFNFGDNGLDMFSCMGSHLDTEDREERERMALKKVLVYCTCTYPSCLTMIASVILNSSNSKSVYTSIKMTIENKEVSIE